MKIFILVPEIKQCGPLNVVRDMLTTGILKKHDIFLIEIRPSGDSDYKNHLKQFVNQIISLNGNNFESLKNYNQLIKEIKPHICHSHGFFPDIFNALGSNKTQKITTIHNVIYDDYYKFYGLKGLIYAIFHYFILYFFIGIIVGCSETIASHLKKVFFGTKNIYSIPNGINLTKFYPIEYEARQTERIKKGYANFKYIYVYSGGLVRRKRVPELIEIFNTELDENSLLIIIGDGNELDLVKDKIKSSNVKYIGRVDNPDYYYQISDYVISNSSSEGYPLAILEAVACGCYAYLSRIPSHKEIFLNLNGAIKFIDQLDDSNFSNVDFELISSETMAKMYNEIYKRI